jgi:hypothetical protein
MPQSAARAAAHASAAKDRSSLYEDITNRIVAELKAGRLPWVQPWGSSGVRAPLGMPKNAATGRTYSGINVRLQALPAATKGRCAATRAMQPRPPEPKGAFFVRARRAAARCRAAR